MDNSNDQNIDKNTGKEKPIIDKTPQYRYPKGYVKDGKKVGGRIMPSSEAEQLAKEGKLSTMTVATSGAVSNQQLQEYKQKLSKYEHAQYGHKFGMAFDKPSHEVMKEQMSKLFDTMTAKISTSIGKVSSSLAEIKKENSASSSKLINLTTAILSAANSQKNTVDELYKIVDTKLSELASKSSGKDDKTKHSGGNGVTKTTGIIRGIGGLNKQLVAINSNMSKMVKLLNTIVEKGGFGTKIEPSITPEEKKEKLDENGKPIDQSSKTKDEKKPTVESRSATFGEGLLKIVGGMGLMGIGASVDQFVKSVGDLKSTIENLPSKIADKTKKLYDTAVDDVSQTFTAMDEGTFTNMENLSYVMDRNKEFLGDILKFVGDLTGMSGDFKEFMGYVDQISSGLKGYGESAVNYFNHDDKEPKDVTPQQEQPKTFNEQAVTSETKSQINPEKTKPDASKEGYRQSTTVVTRGKNIHTPHELYYYKKEPIGQFSVVNTPPQASAVDNYIIKNSITNSTEAVKMASNDVEEIKAERTGANNGSQSPVVINNNNVNNNQQTGSGGPMASVRNTDSTKSMLDRMSLLGGYTGTGYPVN